ncbi:MAG: PqqD family protein [Lachnospiraceae bacterium]|nr:PqqD family protein [Lachnospiraceae bacterium]
MFKNPYFTLINIGKSCYLLPYGQSISDHRRGIKISRSGADLWNMLEDHTSDDDLIQAFISKENIPEAGEGQVISDMGYFLDHLEKLGIILNNKPKAPAAFIRPGEASFNEVFEKSETDGGIFKVLIAGICINLSLDKTLIDAKLASFKTNDPIEPNIRIHTTEKNITVLEKETILVDADEMTISESDSFHIIGYKKNAAVKSMYIRKKNLDVLICLTPGYDNKTASEEIFHAIRIPFLLLAKGRGMYAIHSASVYYREKAWLFSAPAGTGKSTHARLWTTYSDAKDINGDLNLIGMKEGVPFTYGIPWCGTSEVYTCGDFPLGGVIFLKQAPENRIESLDHEKALVTLSRRTISPLWNAASLEKMIQDLEPVSSCITSLRLYCTKEPEAQKLLQDFITNL